jgi:methyl-accepting chemotaxis protein
MQQKSHDSASAALVSELQASLPMLPVLAGQLREVTSQIEKSVVQVCESFQAMAQRARQAAAQVPLATDDGARHPERPAGGLTGLIASTRETMADLLRRIEQTSEFSSVTVQRMGTMEEQIGGLATTLRDIDEVASNARVLALNGQLEAARAGEHGAAFGVVATETAKMAVHAVASSRTIRERITTVSSTISSAAAELRNRAAADTAEAGRSREEVERALDSMTRLHEEMQEAISQAKRNSDQLARDISAAVMAMQFQDSVSQRIGHVVETLEELHRVFAAYVDPAADAPAPAVRDWTNHMAEAYTMDSERRVLAERTTERGNGAAARTQDFGNNVELF